MSPYERIYAAYKRHRPEVDFSVLVGRYLQVGLVFSTPDFFVMGQPLAREGHRLLADNSAEPRDTWHFAAFAGDMSKVWSILPYPLPWIAFTRLRDKTEELTFVELDRMKRLSLPHDSIPAFSPLA